MATIGKFCIIDPTAEIGPDAEIGNYTVVGPGVVLGAGVSVANHCVIDRNVRVGDCTRVWNFVHIRDGVNIGVNCVIGDLVHIGPFSQLGHNVHVGNGAQLHHPCDIGDRAWIGPAVFLSNDPRPNPGAPFNPEPVIVGEGAIIGAQCEIRGGVEIGEQAAVGMGATVTKDVPAGALAYGCPAKIVRERPVHWPGTGWEHRGPLDPTQHCPDCERLSAPQFNAQGGASQ